MSGDGHSLVVIGSGFSESGSVKQKKARVNVTLHDQHCLALTLKSSVNSLQPDFVEGTLLADSKRFLKQ